MTVLHVIHANFSCFKRVYTCLAEPLQIRSSTPLLTSLQFCVDSLSFIDLWTSRTYNLNMTQEERVCLVLRITCIHPGSPVIEVIFSFHYYTEITQKKNSPNPSTSPLRQYTSPSSIVLCIRFQSLSSSVHTYVMTSFTPVVTPFIHNKCCGGW
jgi:hypothetical protein